MPARPPPEMPDRVARRLEIGFGLDELLRAAAAVAGAPAEVKDLAITIARSLRIP